METLKAGCFLVNKNNRSIALIYRDRQKDITFPKGHVELGEDFATTAIRETAEETKRKAIIIDAFEPIIERYVTPKGEHCVCYMFIATDNGHSDNDSLDTHEVRWTPFEEVENALSYDSLKTIWRQVKDKIETLF